LSHGFFQNHFFAEVGFEFQLRFAQSMPLQAHAGLNQYRMALEKKILVLITSRSKIRGRSGDRGTKRFSQRTKFSTIVG